MITVSRKLQKVLISALLTYAYNASFYEMLFITTSVNEVYRIVFYCSNCAILSIVVALILSRSTVSKAMEVIIKSLVIFLLVSGMFQILLSFGDKFKPLAWALYSPPYILILLINYGLCLKRKK